MEAHFFDPSDPFPIIRFQVAFKIVCNINNVYEEAAMWVLPLFDKNTLATPLNSCMSTAA